MNKDEQHRQLVLSLMTHMEQMNDGDNELTHSQYNKWGNAMLSAIEAMIETCSDDKYQSYQNIIDLMRKTQARHKKAKQ